MTTLRGFEKKGGKLRIGESAAGQEKRKTLRVRKKTGVLAHTPLTLPRTLGKFLIKKRSVGEGGPGPEQKAAGWLLASCWAALSPEGVKCPRQVSDALPFHRCPRPSGTAPIFTSLVSASEARSMLAGFRSPARPWARWVRDRNRVQCFQVDYNVG